MIGIEGSTSDSWTSSTASGKQSSNSNTRRLSAEDESYVKDLLRSFSAGSKTDTGAARKQAIEDTKTSINDLFNQYKDTALPQILSSQNKSGGYSATTTQMLSNDAFARTVAAAGQVQLNAINQYETNALNKSQLALSGLSTSLQALLQANETNTAESAFKSKANSATHTYKVNGGFSI